MGAWWVTQTTTSKTRLAATTGGTAHAARDPRGGEASAGVRRQGSAMCERGRASVRRDKRDSSLHLSFCL